MPQLPNPAPGEILPERKQINHSSRLTECGERRGGHTDDDDDDDTHNLHTIKLMTAFELWCPLLSWWGWMHKYDKGWKI